MKNYKRVLAGGLLLVMLLSIMTGCTAGKAEKKQVTLTIKLPPLTVANADTDITDAYDMLVQAGKNFAEQYTEAEVTVNVVKFGYTDEDEYITGCFDKKDAADVLFEGYFNMAGYIHTGRVVPLDDIITDKMKSDIDSTVMKMSQVNGKTYMLPYYSLQNTLCFNKKLFRKCGLDKYIGKEGEIQSWSLKDWEIILSTLKRKLPEMSYPMLMYAKNDQGDTHIMTLIRSQGSKFFDQKGRFHVNTKEGIAALRWIRNSYKKGYFPEGCENLELNDCNTLFLNNQLAIYLMNSATAINVDLKNTGFVNFPSKNGKGYNTSFVTGFEVFDNGDKTKLKAAKDFVSYFYANDELMNYAQIGLPASAATTKRVSDHIFMQEAYNANTSNTVDFTANNPNWRGVRDVFYKHIHKLLSGEESPTASAKAIDADCNAAIEEGWKNSKLHK